MKVLILMSYNEMVIYGIYVYIHYIRITIVTLIKTPISHNNFVYVRNIGHHWPELDTQSLYAMKVGAGV